MDLTFARELIEYWPLDRLKPYVRNVKQHGPDIWPAALVPSYSVSSAGTMRPSPILSPASIELVGITADDQAADAAQRTR